MSKLEIDIVKFNSHEKALKYIQKLGFSLSNRHCFKEDRSFLYTKKFTRQQVFLRSTFDYLNDNTMEMGTVWTVQQFNRK